MSRLWTLSDCDVNPSCYLFPISGYYLNCLHSWIRHRENWNVILKHRLLVSPPTKQSQSSSKFQTHDVLPTWAAYFAGSVTGRINIRFLSTVPWCLIQFSNPIHVVHSSTIWCTVTILYPCLASGHTGKHSPLAVTC